MAKAQSTVTTLESETPETQANDVATEASDGLQGANHDAQLSGKKVTLTIFPGEGETGHDAVQVGHNGFMWLVPRGKPCVVPEEVAWVVRDAKTTTYHMVDGKSIERESPRYAYQITE